MTLSKTDIYAICCTILLLLALAYIRHQSKAAEVEAIRQSEEQRQLEANAILYKLERDQLRIWVDSLVALGDSALRGIPTNRTIFERNETTYKLRATDIIGMPFNDQVQHSAKWLSQADSLRR